MIRTYSTHQDRDCKFKPEFYYFECKFTTLCNLFRSQPFRKNYGLLVERLKKEYDFLQGPQYLSQADFPKIVKKVAPASQTSTVDSNSVDGAYGVDEVDSKDSKYSKESPDMEA